MTYSNLQISATTSNQFDQFLTRLTPSTSYCKRRLIDPNTTFSYTFTDILKFAEMRANQNPVFINPSIVSRLRVLNEQVENPNDKQSIWQWLLHLLLQIGRTIARFLCIISNPEKRILALEQQCNHALKKVIDQNPQTINLQAMNFNGSAAEIILAIKEQIKGCTKPVTLKIAVETAEQRQLLGSLLRDKELMAKVVIDCPMPLIDQFDEEQIGLFFTNCWPSSKPEQDNFKEQFFAVNLPHAADAKTIEKMTLAIHKLDRQSVSSDLFSTCFPLYDNIHYLFNETGIHPSWASWISKQSQGIFFHILKSVLSNPQLKKFFQQTYFMICNRDQDPDHGGYRAGTSYKFDAFDFITLCKDHYEVVFDIFLIVLKEHQPHNFAYLSDSLTFLSDGNFKKLVLDYLKKFPDKNRDQVFANFFSRLTHKELSKIDILFKLFNKVPKDVYAQNRNSRVGVMAATYHFYTLLLHHDKNLDMLPPALNEVLESILENDRIEFVGALPNALFDLQLKNEWVDRCFECFFNPNKQFQGLAFSFTKGFLNSSYRLAFEDRMRCYSSHFVEDELSPADTERHYLLLEYAYRQFIPKNHLCPDSESFNLLLTCLDLRALDIMFKYLPEDQRATDHIMLLFSYLKKVEIYDLFERHPRIANRIPKALFPTSFTEEEITDLHQMKVLRTHVEQFDAIPELPAALRNLMLEYCGLQAKDAELIKR